MKKAFVLLCASGLLASSSASCASHSEPVLSARRALTRSDSFDWLTLGDYPAQGHAQGLRIDATHVAFVGNTPTNDGISIAIYDETAAAFVTSTPPTLLNRRDSPAVLGSDGRVYIVGGYERNTSGGPGELPWIRSRSVDIYDPASDTWESNISKYLTQARVDHAVVAIEGGRRIVVSGGHYGPDSDLFKSTEIFDVEAGTWSAGGDLMYERYAHTMVRLSDDDVLAIGGCADYSCTASYVVAERFDATSGTWSSVHASNASGSYRSALLLDDGRVLVVGGKDARSPVFVEYAEIYDPLNDTWDTTGPFALGGRGNPALVRIADGSIFALGGSSTTGPSTSSVERFELTGASWSSTVATHHAHALESAVVLSDGHVLIAGEGFAERSYFPVLADAGVDFDAGAARDAEVVLDAALVFDASLGDAATVVADASASAVDAALDATRADASIIFDASVAADGATSFADAGVADAALLDAEEIDVADARVDAKASADAAHLGGYAGGGGCAVDASSRAVSWPASLIALGIAASLRSKRRRRTR